MWIGPSGAKQWATSNDADRAPQLRSPRRACGLLQRAEGLPESIRATWPDATVQTCVVHMVRNSLTYASKKDWQPITRATREIYTASTVDMAVQRFEHFSTDWRATMITIEGSAEGHDSSDAHAQQLAG
jgi:putative transposase